MIFCRDCEEEKPETEYRFSRGKLEPWCKTCMNAYQREWRRRNKSKAATYMGNYRGTMAGALRERLANSRWRASEKGWEYDLDIASLESLLETQEGLCYFSGEKLSEEVGNPNRVSLDRLDPKKGYTKDNVVLVCWKVNDAKRALSSEDFINLCRNIVLNVQRLSCTPQAGRKCTALGDEVKI